MRDFLTSPKRLILVLLVFAGAVAHRAGAADRLPVVNVNTADEAQLALLLGVGPKTAEAIVASRPYASADDLVRVKGIGPAKLAKMRPYTVVQGATTATAKIRVAKAAKVAPAKVKPTGRARCGKGMRCGGVK